MKLKPIITQEAFKQLIASQPTNLVLIDASNHATARSNYEKEHLAGAIFVDANEHLATVGSDASEGGRHPLPSIDKFGRILQDLGISKTSHVVIYDDKNGGNSAARFWWMLSAAGHEKVQVLDGGYQATVKAGVPTSSEVEPIPEVGLYTIDRWILPQVTIDEVKAHSEDTDYLVIDVREPNRYKGITEPIDLVAGHIPGAINIPFMSNLDEHGYFLPPDMLRAKYQEIIENFDKDKIIVHCGSGVTACHTLLSLASAGFDIPKLYVGSWSEWSRSGYAIATEK
ncbi:sulfurtransferase [Myroides pelagicus]|uniref:Sulfurtransferase n=1 Tax=Myroides pelagicus TaxID=270914 RepID=A0A7K1GMM6_9FLAO|nr:sulfurtransferase [Myroides pelagicus]MEC4113087.1 sulfurtransferase [Myroides pelagicus]MTH29990.1 sulfurtransferase [Myroides pelagicus]